MTPRASWRCCFRPQVSESESPRDEIIPPSKSGELRDVEKDKCTEDSANADLFARLQCRPIRTDGDGMEDADEDFASPASSYQTCFSEQDPLDLSGMSRFVLYAKLKSPPMVGFRVYLGRAVISEPKSSRREVFASTTEGVMEETYFSVSLTSGWKCIYSCNF